MNIWFSGNRSLMALFVLLAVANPCGAALSLTCQDKEAKQDTPLKLKSQLVEVRAVVTDKQGQPVKGLKKEDFEVLENGHPQNVTFFSAETINSDLNNPGLASPPSKEAKPTESTARTGEAPRRTVIIFVDSLTMEPGNLLRSKAALRRFVDEKITDNDMTAIVSTSGSVGVKGLFTSDKKALHYLIDRLTPAHLE